MERDFGAALISLGMGNTTNTTKLLLVRASGVQTNSGLLSSTAPKSATFKICQGRTSMFPTCLNFLFIIINVLCVSEKNRKCSYRGVKSIQQRRVFTFNQLCSSLQHKSIIYHVFKSLFLNHPLVPAALEKKTPD